VANNPSVCALAQALHPDFGKKSLRDIRLLSVSTGSQPKYIDVQDGDWGLAQWGIKLVNILLEGGVGLADYQCKQILGKYYLRLDPILPVPVELDKVDGIPILQTVAWQYDLAKATAWLKRYFKSAPPGDQSPG
jgi:hypothetical protein